ncbi:MAG: lipopolysaccharide biosynthesis protein [Draconibacterium sp.]
MSDKLKQKTIHGLFWSFLDNFAKLGVQFIVGIILARILSPREFGLVGMITIFIAVSQTFVDSGFGAALIRKKVCSDTDYSTVFFFNLVIALAVYFLLFISAGAISNFFDEPQLAGLVKVLGLGIIFSSFGIIQQTILTREINFKIQTKATLIASLGSGGLAVTMALLGFGVWSLVALTVSRFAIATLFLWIWSPWRPVWVFSMRSFKELFSFGSKLLISAIIDTVYQNVYLLIIGKYFSAQDLGFYTRADQFRNLPSKNIMAVVQRVSYPVLSSIQEEKERLRSNYQKLIRSTMMITFLLMLGMVAVAKPMVLTLIGEKWEPSVVYLQLLCLVGMFYPLQALNLNMLNVKGRSDLFLKLEIVKKLFAVPVIIIGIVWGIKIMIVGMIVNSIIGYLINSYFSGQLIGYSTIQQIKDILPSFLLAIIVNVIVFFIGEVLTSSSWIVLGIQLILGAALFVGFGEILKMHDYLYIKKIILEQWQKYRRR